METKNPEKGQIASELFSAMQQNRAQMLEALRRGEELYVANEEARESLKRVIVKGFTLTPDFVKMGVTQIQTVEFEVMVRAEEQSGQEDKLNVVAAIVGGNVKGEVGQTEGHSATIRFRVPINLEVVNSV
jgi:hypothetical protein